MDVDFEWLAEAPDFALIAFFISQFGEVPHPNEISRWRARFAQLAGFRPTRRRVVDAADIVLPEGAAREALAMSDDDVIVKIFSDRDMLALLAIARSFENFAIAGLQGLAWELFVGQRIGAAKAALMVPRPANFPASNFNYDRPRHVISDLLGYIDTKLNNGPLPEYSLCIPRSARAVFNASTSVNLEHWQADLKKAKSSSGLRDYLFRKLHREGVEILLTPPDLSRPEPGPPRGVWPPPPPPEPEPVPGDGEGAAAVAVPTPSG